MHIINLHDFAHYNTLIIIQKANTEASKKPTLKTTERTSVNNNGNITLPTSSSTTDLVIVSGTCN